MSMKKLHRSVFMFTYELSKLSRVLKIVEKTIAIEMVNDFSI